MTRLRDRAPLSARVALVAMATAFMVVALAACGGGNDERVATVTEVVVPLGTQDRIAAGETVTVMPSRLELKVGDTLRIRNEDVVDQSVGPYTVKAGEQIEMRYGSPGRFEGWCPLSEDETYEIVITD